MYFFENISDNDGSEMLLDATMECTTVKSFGFELGGYFPSHLQQIYVTTTCEDCFVCVDIHLLDLNDDEGDALGIYRQAGSKWKSN